MFILLANQRSGTNLLRGILNHSPKIAAIPEIFHDIHFKFKKLPDFIYYDDYLYQKIQANPSLALPKRRPSVVADYFDWIADYTRKNDFTAICDIKYNSLHHAYGQWEDPLSTPNTLKIIKSKNFPVIHLRRRDHLAMAVSLFRAQNSLQFFVDNNQEVQKTSFSIKPEELLNRIEIQKKTEQLLTNWLRHLKLSVHEVFYEDFFIREVGSSLSKDTFSNLIEFIGHDIEEIDLNPKTQRTSPACYADEIINYDEIEIALRETPYHASLTG